VEHGRDRRESLVAAKIYAEGGGEGQLLDTLFARGGPTSSKPRAWKAACHESSAVKAANVHMTFQDGRRESHA
jgi:hypothetical protein